MYKKKKHIKNQHDEKEKISLSFLVVILFLIAIGPISFELYLPSLTDIAHFMHTCIVQVQLTITLFPLGYGIGQLVYGPISDKYGRKKILLIGILIYFLASIGCLFSFNIISLIFFRLIQALGASSTPVLARAIVIDNYNERTSIKILSLVGAVMGFAPAISPILGGYIVYYFNWHAVFIVMILFALTILWMVWFWIKDNHQQRSQNSLTSKLFIENCRDLLTDRKYFLNTIIMISFYSGLFAFITQTPILFMNILGIPKHLFGPYFSVIIVFYAIGNLLTSKLVNFFSLNGFKLFAAILGVIAGIISILTEGFYPLHMMNIILGSVLYALSVGLIFPISMASAISSNRKNVGMASGILGFFQMMIASLVGSLVSYGFSRNIITLGICMFISALVGLMGSLLLYFSSSPKTEELKDEAPNSCPI